MKNLSSLARWTAVWWRLCVLQLFVGCLSLWDCARWRNGEKSDAKYRLGTKATKGMTLVPRYFWGSYASLVGKPRRPLSEPSARYFHPTLLHAPASFSRLVKIALPIFKCWCNPTTKLECFCILANTETTWKGTKTWQGAFSTCSRIE